MRSTQSSADLFLLIALGAIIIACAAPAAADSDVCAGTAAQDTTMIGHFQAAAHVDRIIVMWTTTHENGAVGFHVLRSDAGGPMLRITAGLIAGLGAPATYQYEDRDVEAGRSYGYGIEVVSRDGSSRIFDFTDRTVELPPPVDLRLDVTFVNPVEPPTGFTVVFPRASLATLRVYDLSGRCRASIELPAPQAGRYFFPWDGSGNDGQPLQSGIFFARLVAGDEVLTRKVVLLSRRSR